MYLATKVVAISALPVATNLFSHDNEPATISGTAVILAAVITVYFKEKKGQDQQRRLEQKIGDPDLTKRESLDAKLNNILKYLQGLTGGINRLRDDFTKLRSEFNEYKREHNRRHEDEIHRKDF